MSSWTVPLSSSPQAPSTPGSGQRPLSTFTKSPNGFAKKSFTPNPSTTPAGPPPSSVGSFTPADPPPSSVFGSSQLGLGKTLFKSKASAGANPGHRRSVNYAVPPSAIDGNKLARYLDKSRDIDFRSSNGASTRNTFGVPSSSPPFGGDEQEDSYEEESEVFNEGFDAEGSEEESVESTVNDRSLDLGSEISSLPNGSLANGNSAAFGSSIIDATPRGVKRSRGGSMISRAPHRSAKRPSKPKQDSTIPRIAKSVATQRGVANLKERDEFITGTEEIVLQNLYGTEEFRDVHGHALDAELATVSERLSNFWRTSCSQDIAMGPSEQETIKGIGPDESAPPVHRAAYLGALLLQLRHPPTARGKQALALARYNRSSLNSKLSQHEHIPSNPTAIPKVLVDWLSSSHNPYESLNAGVQRFHPNPTAHINYWDIVFSLTLRGKLADVIQLLKRSNFHNAKTAKEDRKDSNGYSDIQVRNIERVVNRAIQVLEQCPTLLDENWNVTGNEWIIFRKRVEQDLNDLATFAEGWDRDRDPAASNFEASNFGLRSTKMGLSQSARKAESRVPWTVYQNLKTMYGILLGETTEILAMAQDWVEATIGLTVWWVGDDDGDIAVGSVALTRRSLRQSQSHNPRLVDVNKNAAYLRRLALSFECVNGESSDNKDLPINTLNPVEVGLASVFEGNVEGVIGLLRAWSLTVASAVAEVANAGGWFESSVGPNIMNGLDESDLMTMSLDIPQEQPMTRDTILMEYADALFSRPEIQGTRAETRGEAAHEGWEFSIAVLNRLHDRGLATKRVGELLDRLQNVTDQRMDKILRTCEQFQIIEQARKKTEEYADHIAENSDNYGTALTYYARAHCQKKVKNVLDLLITMCLVKSTAHPVLSDLDFNLHALIFTPDQSLAEIAQVDQKAAEMLHMYLAGYATLRRFYDLRDEAINLKEGQKARSGPKARKSAAATALLAVVNSAADNIHGGLYDEDRGAVVQVDGLLALLGEAMVFVNQPSGLLTLPQCFALLRAIEDLQTVTSRVYNQCEECFRSTLAECQGRAAPPSTRELLKKTMSSMTSASSFSLLGSSMLDSESSSGMGSSTALVKPEGKTVRRGWDWRKGLQKDAKGEDVLRILRLGLAKDIARHYTSGEGV